MTQHITKDSGEKQVFPSGYQRDTHKGKPRFDLIPVPALRRVADLYARGAEKYGERNWELGAPLSRFHASMLRHVFAFGEGKRDEDHLAAVVWNALSMMHLEEYGDEELDDMPVYDAEDEIECADPDQFQEEQASISHD